MGRTYNRRMLLRPAVERDAAALQSIYAHHVLHGLASFEEAPPDTGEMRARLADVRSRHLPYFVAEDGGEVVGFGYAAPYRLRSAYRYALEDSIYVREGSQRRGIGRTILAALIRACEASGARQLIAVIGDSANEASIGLHAALGFSQAGVLRSAGFKFGRWVDVVLMQRPLGEADRTSP